MKHRIGCHLSIAGGVCKAVERAREAGCSAFQIFTRNPRGWAHGPLTDDDIDAFARLDHDKEALPITHMPYLPNLAAPNKDNYKRSVETLTSELERCEKLRIPYLVTHLGSHLGEGEEDGRKRIAAAMKTAFKEADSKTMILMENTAGTRNSMGTTPAELAQFIEMLDGEARLGICIDTAHAFAAGYDWREGDQFASEIRNAGIADRIKVLHLNDSKVALDGHADRHDHLGLGEIGLEGLRRAANHPLFKKLPVILETPVDDRRGDAENLRIAFELKK